MQVDGQRVLEEVEADLHRGGVAFHVLKGTATDARALHLAGQLRARGVRVSRLARGLPSGWQLEFANKAVLADAIAARQTLEES